MMPTTMLDTFRDNFYRFLPKINEKDLVYLRNSIMDWKVNGLNEGFDFINPNEKIINEAKDYAYNLLKENMVEFTEEEIDRYYSHDKYRVFNEELWKQDQKIKSKRVQYLGRFNGSLDYTWEPILQELDELMSNYVSSQNYSNVKIVKECNNGAILNSDSEWVDNKLIWSYNITNNILLYDEWV